MRRTSRPAANGNVATPGTQVDAFIAAIGHRLREPLNAIASALPHLQSSVDAVRERAIEVVNRAVREGSTTVIEVEGLLHWLTLRGEAGAIAGATTRTDTMTRTRLPRLLLVDDVVDAIEMWAFFFRAAAYDVLTATTGRQAFAAARRGLPDIILLDLQLPDCSGMEVAKRLRNDPKTKSIPIIAVTGLSSPKDHDAARAAGCLSVVTKPCNPDDLLRKVEGVLGTARQQPA